MIQSIEIKNFQSHKNTKLQFSPGVNVIVGTSDSGKTAILRALKWAATNKPSGDAFCSTWGGVTEVTLKTNKATVVRKKEGSKNQYSLINGLNGASPIVFEAFGTNIPEEIDNALNLKETNLQQQLDAPFLLSETSGTVASHFNRIANLEVIDKASQKIDKAIREIKSNTTFKENAEITQRTLLSKFEYLDKFEVDLEVLEDMEKDMVRQFNEVRAVTILLNSLDEISRKINSYSYLLAYEKEVNSILSLMQTEQEIYKRIERIETFIASLEYKEEQLLEAKEILKYEKEVNSILLLLPAKDSYKKEIKELDLFLYNLERTEEKFEKQKSKLNRMQKQFTQNMPSTCPLCGTKLKNNAKN